MLKVKLQNNTICEVKKVMEDDHSKEFFLNNYFFVTVIMEGENFERTFWLTETEYENMKVK